jgi:hypothetical protein
MMSKKPQEEVINGAIFRCKNCDKKIPPYTGKTEFCGYCFSCFIQLITPNSGNADLASLVLEVSEYDRKARVAETPESAMAEIIAECPEEP